MELLRLDSDREDPVGQGAGVFVGLRQFVRLGQGPWASPGGLSRPRRPRHWRLTAVMSFWPSKCPAAAVKRLRRCHAGLQSAVFALVAFTLEALPVGRRRKPVEVTPYVALGSAGHLPSAPPSRSLSRRRSVSRQMLHIVVARAASTR